MARLEGRFTVEEIGLILKAVDGNVTLAANRLGVSRVTLHAWIKKHQELTDAIHDARQGIVDMAESQLKAAVLRGEKWAIMLTLTTIGKDRGYNRDKKMLPDLERLLDGFSEDLADEIRRAISEHVS